MRIGYSKIGRNMPLSQESWGFVGGDDEPPLLLKDLAERNPQHTFVLCGRNSGEVPQDIGFPANVENPWTEWRKLYKAAGKSLDDRAARIEWFDTHVLPTFRDLDQHVVWLGQHGTSNTPIPQITKGVQEWNGELTDPQDSFMQYVAYILRGLNAWRTRQQATGFPKQEIYVIADGRNHHKARDAKWPVTMPILGQYNQTRTGKYERYNDWNPPEHYGYQGTVEPGSNGRIWCVKQTYVYSRLEICGILPWHIDSEFDSRWDDRRHFGLFINEARKVPGPKARLPILRDWALPLEPAFVHGKWTDQSLAEIGRTITSAPWEDYYPLIRSVRSTFTTPSSGTGWATTKPWQAFAVGTVCFFHPDYDTQNNILNDADPDLKKWLRVKTPAELEHRVMYLDSLEGKQAWSWLVHKQREHYDKAVTELKHLKMIEERFDD
jgi:hypothetical protein